jgi:hypothetical protein
MIACGLGDLGWYRGVGVDRELLFEWPQVVINQQLSLIPQDSDGGGE